MRFRSCRFCCERQQQFVQCDNWSCYKLGSNHTTQMFEAMQHRIMHPIDPMPIRRHERSVSAPTYYILKSVLLCGADKIQAQTHLYTIKMFLRLMVCEDDGSTQSLKTNMEQHVFVLTLMSL